MLNLAAIRPDSPRGSTESPVADSTLGWSLLEAAGRAPPAEARRAAAELIRLLRPRAYALAVRMLGQPAAAEDAVQESFLRLWRHRPSQVGEATLSTYFYRVVMNESLRLLGKRKRQELVLEDLDESLTLDSFSASAAISESGLSEDPLVARLAACEADQLQLALSKIPDRQRVALVLWAYEDLTVPEIAQLLALQENAVHQLLYRAKASLRKLMIPDPFNRQKGAPEDV